MKILTISNYNSPMKILKIPSNNFDNWQQIMIPDLKDDRLFCNLCRGYFEVDGVVVGWIGSALHLVAHLHLLIKLVI